MTLEEQLGERVENALLEAADAANGFGSIDPNFDACLNLTLDDDIVQAAIQLALMGMSTRVGDIRPTQCSLGEHPGRARPARWKSTKR